MKKILHLLPLFLLLPIIVGLNTPVLQVEKRIALVIGNGAYQHHAALKNPTNDASEMAKTLKNLDFEVMKVLYNANQREMDKALKTFYSKIKYYEQQNYKVISLFYFSGHGMHVDDMGYLIPIGANTPCPLDLKYEAVKLNKILEKLDAFTNYLNIVMIDACRDNAYTKKQLKKCYQEQNPTKGTTPDDLFDGLPEPEGNSDRSNMFISYAAAPNKTADSGDTYNTLSPYVTAFTEHVKQPNTDIVVLFSKHVSRRVKKITKNAQQPWYDGSFDGDFVFKKEQKPRDTDGDGYIDRLDDCPRRYATTNNGCPQDKYIKDMLTDKDNDGVPDLIDQEQNTPAGAEVNSRGVTLDSDNDGIPNHLDKEPYSPVGYKIAPSTGISEKSKIPKTSSTTTIKDWFLPMIHFDLDGTKVKPKYYAALAHIATVLRKNPSVNVVVEGHADTSSSVKYNLGLSYKRAQNAINFLTSNYGFSRDRFILRYNAKAAPLVPNTRNNYMNRRVEFRVAKGGETNMSAPQ